MIGARVDALSIAYRFRMDSMILQRLQAAKGAVMTIAVEAFDVKAHGKRFTLQNPRGFLIVGEGEAIVDLSVPFLASTDLCEVIAYGIKLVGALAVPGAAIDSGQVRELDLCADVAGATFGEIDRNAFVSRLRKVHAWESISTRKHDRTVFTGMRIGTQASLSITLYDKIGELTARHGATSDRAIDERARWTANGWNGEGPVWRAEVRFRGRMLAAYGLREPATLADKIDPAWKAVTTQTLRLVVRGSSSRPERCKTDLRWAALQGATFTREGAAPAERVGRVRGGAAMGQGLGTMASALARCGVPRHAAEDALRVMLRAVGANDHIDTLGSKVAATWARLGGVA